MPWEVGLRIDSEDLRRHYASITGDELAAINAEDLTEAARAVYAAELARRGLPMRLEGEGPSASAPSLGRRKEVDETVTDVENAGASAEFDIDVGPPPDWLEDAACACCFESRPGDTALPSAVQARLGFAAGQHTLSNQLATRPG